MYSLKCGNAYFKISDPMKGTAMWIAVHDATVANGTLHVIPGSFRVRYEHYRDPNSDHHIRHYPPGERAVPCRQRPFVPFQPFRRFHRSECAPRR